MHLFTFVSVCLVLGICNNLVAATLTEPTFWVEAVYIEKVRKSYYWIYLKEIDDKKVVKVAEKKMILMKAYKERDIEKPIQDIEIESHVVPVVDLSGALSWEEGLKELNRFLSEKQGLNRRIILCPSYEKFAMMEPFLKKLLSCDFDDCKADLKEFPDVSGSDLSQIADFCTSRDLILRPTVEIYNWNSIARNRMMAKFRVVPEYCEKVFKDLTTEWEKINYMAKNVDQWKNIKAIKEKAIKLEEAAFQKIAKNGVFLPEDFDARNA